MKLPIKLIFLVPILLTVLVSGIFLISQTSLTENIPEEDPTAQNKLNNAITKSKFNIEEGIYELENLKELSDYTEYKKHYILAKLYENKGENNKAISTYEKLLNKNYPLKERVIFHLANLNIKNGDDKKALKFLNKLLHDFPHSKSVPQTKYYLAQTQFRLKYKNQALNTLKSLKFEFPDTQYGIGANYYLGENEYNNENYDKALNLWREYLKLSPDGRFAEEIVNILESQRSISLTPQDYTLIGDVFFHKKDYKNSAFYYQKENNPEKYYNLGYSLFRINRKNEAAKYLKEYAYSFPKDENTIWALYYAGISIPSYERKSFWSKITKDIPELAYYTIYKEAISESNTRKREKLLTKYISNYPKSIFTLDAVWEIMWQKTIENNYLDAQIIGEKYFKLTKDLKDENPDTWPKIGFWLGKIAEINNQNEKAINYYKQVASNSLFDNYYAYRAKGRLSELNGNIDSSWKLQSSTNEFINYNWSIPTIIRIPMLKRHYGATVTELVRLQQFDEAIDLIGKSNSPSIKITSWLKALNKEFDISIKTATSLTNKYNLDKNNPIWNLAYPLHFWFYIISTCQKYQNIDPLLVCGIIRQESRFDEKATSTSDARGLMQLIPPTARTVAAQTNINLNSLDLLYNPETNISLGIKYLSGLLSDFNNPLFAVSSYNAGPNATKRWINMYGVRDLDFFVEKIPYAQTKDYVKKVFANYWTYLNLYKPDQQVS